jgi:hypothetical protein
MAITPFILLNRSSVKRVWLVHVVWLLKLQFLLRRCATLVLTVTHIVARLVYLTVIWLSLFYYRLHILSHDSFHIVKGYALIGVRIHLDKRDTLIICLNTLGVTCIVFFALLRKVIQSNLTIAWYIKDIVWNTERLLLIIISEGADSFGFVCRCYHV